MAVAGSRLDSLISAGHSSPAEKYCAAHHLQIVVCDMLPHGGVRSAHSERREEMSTVCHPRLGKNETGNLVFRPAFVYRKFVYLLCEFDFGAPRSLSLCRH
jgi:hypothetical protein